MKTIADLVSEQAIFRDLSKDHRDFIAGCGRNHTFEAGELLLREGDEANHLFALRKGRVAIGIHVPERGNVTIETVDPGEIVGWSWLFPPYKAHFDARAMVTTHAIEFDGACLRKKCDADPVLGYAMMKCFAALMVSRIEATRLQLLDVYGSVR